MMRRDLERGAGSSPVDPPRERDRRRIRRRRARPDAVEGPRSRRAHQRDAARALRHAERTGPCARDSDRGGQRLLEQDEARRRADRRRHSNDLHAPGGRRDGDVGALL